MALSVISLYLPLSSVISPHQIPHYINYIVRKQVIAIGLLMVAVIATGCSALRCKSTVEPPAAVAQREYTLIVFDGTVEGIGVSGQVRMAKDSLIWCSVSKLVELGRAKASPDTVWVRIPMAGRNEKMDYRRVGKYLGFDITYGEVQAILESDNAAERVAALAQKAGHQVNLRIKRREKVKQLTFPY